MVNYFSVFGATAAPKIFNFSALGARLAPKKLDFPAKFLIPCRIENKASWAGTIPGRVV